MKTLKKLFLDGLAEIYDTESRLVWSMPQMAAAATCTHLQEAVLSHLQETKTHVAKIETIFQSLGERTRRKTSEATIAFVNESQDIMTRFRGFPVINAALIAAVQKIEHYEIASYGCLRDWASVLHNKEAADILQEILDEDKATNQALTELARTRSNHEALSEHVMNGTRHLGAAAEIALDMARFDAEAPAHEHLLAGGDNGRSSKPKADAPVVCQMAACG